MSGSSEHRRVALVTGGAAGIGAAVCVRLAADGYRVAVVDRDAESAARVAEECGGLAVGCDVTSDTAIATSSLAGLTGMPGDAIYTLSKHAVVGYVRSAAATLAGEPVRVMAVCPGFTDTALIADVRDHFGDFPLLGAPDVAEAVATMITQGGSGECWFVQPGRDAAPFRFRGVPGPADAAAPPPLHGEG